MGHWTYAGDTLKSRPSRRYLRAGGHSSTLRVSASGRAAATRPALNRPLRLLLTAGLLLLCLGALNREPGLHAALVTRLGRSWDQVCAALQPGPQGPAAHQNPRAIKAPEVFTPVALLVDSGVFALGADGRLQPCRADFFKQDLAVISGCQVREVPEPMGIVLKTEVPMDMVRKVLKSPLSHELSEMAFGHSPEVVLYTRDAVKIRLRAGPQLDQDLMRLAAVWADARSRQLDPAVIDLRFAPQIVVRPRNRR